VRQCLRLKHVTRCLQCDDSACSSNAIRRIANCVRNKNSYEAVVQVALIHPSILADTVREWFRWKAHFKLYDQNAVLHRSPPFEPGLQSIKEWYRSLSAAFPDANITLGNVVTEGDFVANSFRLRGTHRGPFLGVAASGKRFDVEGATILKFAEGKCVERWSQTDVMGIMRQISSRNARKPCLSLRGRHLRIHTVSSMRNGTDMMHRAEAAGIKVWHPTVNRA
jgi:predicted ester cyclase